MSIHQMEINFEALIELISFHLYKDKSAVIRELLSNANDSLTARKQESGFNGEEPRIQLWLDQQHDRLIVKDNGIGMSHNDLIIYLSTIGESLTRKRKIAEEGGLGLDEFIGRFGIGFISSFVVAHRIIVDTRKQGNPGYRWESNGKIDYTISEKPDIDYGTTIFLYLKTDVRDEWTDEKIKKMVLENARNFIYPIYWGAECEHSLNDFQAPWYAKKIVDEDELDKLCEFLSRYETRFASAESALEIIPLYDNDIRGVVYIPPVTAIKNEKIGVVDLYCKRVFVAKDVSDIIPPLFSFIKGIVDCFSFRLTAARDEVMRDDHNYNRVTKFIETQIMERLQFLASRAQVRSEIDESDFQARASRRRLQEIMNHYHLAIKFALINKENHHIYYYPDQYLLDFENFMLFQTNFYSSATIPEYLVRMGALVYKKAILLLQHDDDFITNRAIAEREKSEFILIRHQVEEDYLKRYSQIIGIECISATEVLRKSITKIAPSEGWEQIIRYYKDRLPHPEFSLSVYLSEFLPESVLGRLIADKDSDGLKRMEDLLRTLDESKAIDKNDVLYKEIERLKQKRPHSLFINKRNPTLKRLVELLDKNIAFDIDTILHSIFHDMVIAAGHQVNEGHLTEYQTKAYGEILAGIEFRNNYERYRTEFEKAIENYERTQDEIAALRQQLVDIRPLSPSESQRDAFFIRPFVDKQDGLPYNFISEEIGKICEKFDLNFVDPKHKRDPGDIIPQIRNHLRTSRLIIADVSDLNNANVYYEIGYVHGAFPNKLLLIGEESVIKSRKLPFDFSGLRILTYHTSARKFKEFTKELESLIVQKIK